EAARPNTPAPLELDVAAGPWPATRYDAVFSANTLHIMAWAEVEALFARLPASTTDDAVLAIYGPFHRDGRPTSERHAACDAHLRARAAHMGVRDLADVDALAARAGFTLQAEHVLPAHNRCVVWRRGWGPMRSGAA